MSKRIAKVGDWVRFYQGGKLVIGVVAYRVKDDVLGGWELMTDVGTIDEKYVQEIRSEVQR